MSVKKILLSAFACDPVFGSDEEVGWQWARELSSRGLTVTVITRASHQQAIEQHINRTGDCAQVRFVYVDLPKLHKLTMLINRRNHIYYYFWQWAAYLCARKIQKETAFDLVHHVTWVSFRQPSFMGMLGIPFMFGPVAGGDEIPHGYGKAFGGKARIKEWVRVLANRFVRVDPLMYLTYSQARQILFTSDAHLARVPTFARRKARVELAIGSDMPEIEASPPVHSAPNHPTRLLFVGRCIGLKGMDLGLEIFSLIRKTRPDVSLTIIGDGEDRTRWEATATRLGVADAVIWRGWLPKAQVQSLYQDFDLLFYPSLRDSGGFVVLEALQHGMPVVCFKLGGPGVVVDASCGAAVAAIPDVELAISNYAEAVLHTLARLESDPQLSASCIARARQFIWPALIDRIYQG